MMAQAETTYVTAEVIHKLHGALVLVGTADLLSVDTLHVSHSAVRCIISPPLVLVRVQNGSLVLIAINCCPGNAVRGLRQPNPAGGSLHHVFIEVDVAAVIPHAPILKHAVGRLFLVTAHNRMPKFGVGKLAAVSLSKHHACGGV